VDFACDAIRRSYEPGLDSRYGVNFEAGLGKFIAAVEAEREKIR